MLALGFKDAYEVAVGADVGCIAEAHHYVKDVVTGKLPFLFTSCCPAWAVLVKKQFPDLAAEVSQELTPMVATARSVKTLRPNARVVFIGPCAAKKLEASRRTIRSYVDFVITFEELAGMFDAKGLKLEELEELPVRIDATGAGRGYACAGGVAGAIEKCINEYFPGTEVKIAHAEGLADCKKMAGEISSRFTVVSGFADGADSAALEGALAAGGKVISVFANGLDYIYPAINRPLADKVEKCGLIITEYPPEVGPKPYHFPVRNRIIAGLSKGTLVVSADKTSGALITADYAADYGRDVFAFPYSIGAFSGAGCNALIKKGAFLAENILDISEYIV